MKKRYGICDIARQVGMSPATVSLVLNDKWEKKVRPEIAEQVVALAARHGYTGNPAARGLVLQRHFRVALCVAHSFVMRPLIGSFSFHALLAELAARLGTQRYAMNIVTIDDAARLDMLRAAAGQNDALLFLGWHSDELNSLLPGLATEVPLLALDCEVNEGLASCVVVDPVPGIEAALEYLVGAGHRNLAFVRGESQTDRYRMKLNIYQEVLRRHRIAFNPDLVVNQPQLSPVARGYAAGESLLDMNPAPTAVFCSDALCAVGMTHVLRERGLNVPQDMEVIAYGDLSLADLCVPPLSFVQLPTVLLAERAVEVLFELIQNGNTPRKIICAADFIPRGTTRG